MCYIGWHKLIKALGPDKMVRIEDMEEELPKYISGLGLELRLNNDVTLKRAAFEHLEHTAAELRTECGERVIDELEILCEEYG